MPLKMINGLAAYQLTREGFNNRLVAKTHIPGNPVLIAFCCDPYKVPLHQPRTGVIMWHGSKYYFPCVPIIYIPESREGNIYTFTFPICQCGNGRKVTWVLGELGAPPLLQWTSLAHEGQICNAQEITVTNLSPAFINIPYPPGVTYIGSSEGGSASLYWATTVAIIQHNADWQAELKGEAFAVTPGAGGGDVTWFVNGPEGFFDATSVSVPPWPDSVPIHSVWDGTTPPGPFFSGLSIGAGYEASGAVAGIRGVLTIRRMPY